METKQTPGPWQVNKKVKTTVETCADGQGINIIADCSDIDGLRTRTESEANAAIIAQAPDILAERDRLLQVNAELVTALEDASFLLAKVGKYPGDLPQFMGSIIRSVQDARAAISKAKGGAK